MAASPRRCCDMLHISKQALTCPGKALAANEDPLVVQSWVHDEQPSHRPYMALQHQQAQCSPALPSLTAHSSAASFVEAQPSCACRWSPTEKRELIRRRLLLLFYLLRSPFFDLYTRWAWCSD